MRLAGAIFDLDGTIADTFAICFATFRNALAHVSGPALTDAEIQARFGPSEDGMFQRVVPERWEEAFGVYLGEYERHLPLCALFPVISTVLAWLGQRGVPLALVTGKSRPTALMSLKAFGLDGMFDPVETGSPSGVVKAAAIARVVSGWRVPAHEVITSAMRSATYTPPLRRACTPWPRRGRRRRASWTYASFVRTSCSPTCRISTRGW
jgi:pyrophosphatase PpaX